MSNSMRTTAIVTCFLLFIFFVLWGLGEALAPLIIAFGLAYLFFPLIEKLEKIGLNRRYTVPGLFVMLALLVVLIISFFLPGLIEDVRVFVKELPDTTTSFINKIQPITERLGYPLDFDRESIRTLLSEHVTEISGGLLKNITLGIKSSFTGIAKIIIAILNFFLIPLFFFYVIIDYEKLSNSIRSFIPKSFRPKLNHYLSLTNDVLSGYIRGQLMVALALSVLYTLGLYIVGLKFGLFIGVLSGLISVIPYAGFSIGFATAIFVGLANYTGVGQLVGIVSVYVAVQALEGAIITPRLVGNKVGLNAFTTLLALIIGGNLFNLVGMLVAIPIAAIMKSIMNELVQEYKKLDFYKA